MEPDSDSNWKETHSSHKVLTFVSSLKLFIQWKFLLHLNAQKAQMWLEKKLCDSTNRKINKITWYTKKV